MVKSLELEVSSILHCLSNVENINLYEEDFYTNGDILYLYKAIKGLYFSDGIVTLATLRDYLYSQGKQSLVSYLDGIDNTYSAEEVSLLLRKRYNRRVAYELREINPDDENYIFLLQEVMSKYRGGYSFNIKEVYDKTISHIREKSLSMFPIGIEEIDSVIDISPDRYITIGGASGSGKTAFTVFLVDRLCRRYTDRVNILFVSLEMSEVRIMQRLIDLNLKVRLTHENIDKYLDDVLSIREQVSAYPLSIIYSSFNLSKLSLLMQSHINESKRKGLVPICFLDHYGEVVGLDEVSAKLATDKITSLCKNFAMQGGIMIGLTQLRKDLLDKRNKDTFFKPNNSYIMNSQSVEARSDIILHLWRPEHHNIYEVVYEEGDVIHSIDTRNAICLIVDKNRDGVKKDIWLNCDIAINYFEPISEKKYKVYSN